MTAATLDRPTVTETATLDPSCCARLPIHLLYIAAQFAEQKKGYRDAIKAIRVRKLDDGKLLIESTDGHRAFRCTFSESQAYTLCCESLIVSAEAFKKRVAGAVAADFDRNGMAVATDVIGGIKGAMQWTSIYGDDTYPNTDHVWPDDYQFTNNPGGKVAFNAGYMADFMKQAATYAVNGTARMELISPHAPLRFTADADIPGLGVVELQYLLMPVQIRD